MQGIAHRQIGPWQAATGSGQGGCPDGAGLGNAVNDRRWRVQANAEGYGFQFLEAPLTRGTFRRDAQRGVGNGRISGGEPNPPGEGDAEVKVPEEFPGILAWCPQGASLQSILASRFVESIVRVPGWDATSVGLTVDRGRESPLPCGPCVTGKSVRKRGVAGIWHPGVSRQGPPQARILGTQLSPSITGLISEHPHECFAPFYRTLRVLPDFSLPGRLPPQPPVSGDITLSAVCKVLYAGVPPAMWSTNP